MSDRMTDADGVTCAHSSTGRASGFHPEDAGSTPAARLLHVTVEFTTEQAQIVRDALKYYEEDRRKVARRRDRREGGFHVERALSGFFELCQETQRVMRKAVVGW